MKGCAFLYLLIHNFRLQLVTTGQRSKGDASYDPVRIGKPQTPYLIRGLEATFDVLFALVLGKGTDLLLETEKHEPRSVTFVNKFSGKALEVENSSDHQGARIQRVTLSGVASQHWFVRFTKFIRCRTIPSTIGRQTQRFWAAFLQFPAAGYSLVADHSGLCLDIPSGLVLVLDVADNSLKNYATVWQYPLNGGDSQRWQLLK